MSISLFFDVSRREKQELFEQNDKYKNRFLKQNLESFFSLKSDRCKHKIALLTPILTRSKIHNYINKQINT